MTCRNCEDNMAMTHGKVSKQMSILVYTSTYIEKPSIFCCFRIRSQSLRIPKNHDFSVESRNEMESNHHSHNVWTVFTTSYSTLPFQRHLLVVFNETPISFLTLILRWMFRLFLTGLRKCNRFFDLASSDHSFSSRSQKWYPPSFAKFQISYD